MKKPHEYLRVDDECELRFLSEEDAPALFNLADENRARLRQWLPWVDSTTTVEHELAFIRTIRIQYEIDGRCSYKILYKGQLAGTVGYNYIDWINRKTELGYWLAENFVGRGLITRACHTLINHAFYDLDLNKVEIHCATNNVRSCAVPQRLGFKHEGIDRQSEWVNDHFVDLNVFGLLASEWKR
jgi:ribosomal-protein-serine acetyltransferase